MPLPAPFDRLRLPVIGSPEVVQLLDKYGVLSPRETQSRQDIYLEQYVKTKQAQSPPRQPHGEIP